MTFPAGPMGTGQEIRRPYEPDPMSPENRRRSLLVLVGAAAFCLAYGIAFVYFLKAFPLALIAPLPVMAIIGIWALPETRTAPTRTMVVLTFLFFVCLVMW